MRADHTVETMIAGLVWEEELKKKIANLNIQVLPSVSKCLEEKPPREGCACPPPADMEAVNWIPAPHSGELTEESVRRHLVAHVPENTLRLVVACRVCSHHGKEECPFALVLFRPIVRRTLDLDVAH